jgi:hypothetical protein
VFAVVIAELANAYAVGFIGEIGLVFAAKIFSLINC